MSLETYWLIVPLAGIALSVPIWAWLLLTHHQGEQKRQRDRTQQH
jgi:hypothetical protein